MHDITNLIKLILDTNIEYTDIIKSKILTILIELYNNNIKQFIIILLHLNKLSYTGQISYIFHHKLNKSNDIIKIKNLFNTSPTDLHPEIYKNTSLTITQKQNTVDKLDNEYSNFYSLFKNYLANYPFDLYDKTIYYPPLSLYTKNNTIMHISLHNIMPQLNTNHNIYDISDTDWNNLIKFEEVNIIIYRYYIQHN